VESFTGLVSKLPVFDPWMIFCCNAMRAEMAMTDRLIFDDSKTSLPLRAATSSKAAAEIKLGPVGSNSMNVRAERSKRHSRVEAGQARWIFDQLSGRL
jgi:hypothetical protein